MAVNKSRIAEMARIQKVVEKPNTIVMGPPMSGKTTWVNTQVDTKKTLFISTDGNAIPGSQILAVENYDDVMVALEYVLFNRDDISTIVIDVVDDIVSFAEKRAQSKLGMTQGKTDAKGGYGKFAIAVAEIIKMDILRPLMRSGKQIFLVMHSAKSKDGDQTPCFGSYSSDALDILNWAKGQSGRVVLCTSYAGDFDVTVVSERSYDSVDK